ncbi:hypothetical protein [Fibrobacter sp.]|nr:hypothetical protein [Fibrobacter sp.]MDD5942743.1 hypothetical protein [Fibrobacter sp.]
MLVALDPIGRLTAPSRMTYWWRPFGKLRDLITDLRELRSG